MVSYDAPIAAHDMMLRFMNVDFSLLVYGTPGWESRVGDQERVIAVKGGSEAAQESKGEVVSSKGADWEGASSDLVRRAYSACR